MPVIKIEHVVSFSSEDHNFPAENLLVDGAYKKWKCKIPGESSESVILQLAKSSIINSIHIGNECSAFVEVSVGRSGAATCDFQSLLAGSSFMSPLESKQGNLGQRVRIFQQESLTKPTCFEKWDRIKVTCMQPFNKNIQYGLSFITLEAPEQKEEEPVRKLGRFTLREDDDSDIIPVGSLFAKRKEKAETPMTGAAAIRYATLPVASTSSSDLSSQLTQRVKKVIESTKTLDTSQRSPPDKKVRTTDTKNSPREKTRTKHTSTESSSKASPNEKPKNKHQSPRSSSKEKAKNGHKDKPLKRPNAANPSPPSKKIKPSPSIQRKPFNKLLDGVVFVLSGYQNPGRQLIRDKALEMGGKYKPDWCNGCTHLICAFPNTPKFQQVRGKGHIVSKQWIEDCCSERKRLPWRRYAVDRNDLGKDESEDEILEEISSNAPTVDPVDLNDDDINDLSQAVRHQPVDDSGSDTEDEIERVKLISLQEAEGKKKHDEQKASTITRIASGAAEEDEYGGDTDVDSDSDQRPDTSNIPMPDLPDFFEGKTFFLHSDLQPETKTELQRYIIAFKGTLSENISDPTDFLLADSGDGIKKFVQDHPNVIAVYPSWVWECNDAEKMLPSGPFEIINISE